jgi:DNA mismatch repair protein MutL
MAIVPPVGAERPRVQLLDPHTINQIAAGEVVERPASVVKELVENALDAGAKRIEVDLEDAGRALISVRDDGSGMSPEDAQAALLRHATSKIRSADDLAEVGTLGFRGEALPSIASVSVMRLRSAVRDGEGVEIEVEGGRARPARPVALARGTEVRVENLFFNTPARLKFLKSPATELGAAMEVVSKFALAYPDVSFTLRHNGHEAIRTSGNGDLLSALADVWGRDLARGLAEVDAQVGGIHVHGFISPPHLTRPTRTYQYLFVNGRPVRTRTLTAALDQAYREITPERRFPVLVLHLDLDPARVDVNVSPTKSEVKFDREGAAFDALRIAIKSALMEHGMIPDAAGVAAANEALQATELRTPWLPRPDGGLLSQVAQAPLGEPSAEAEPASLSLPTAVSDALAETASMPSLGPSRSDRMPFAHLAEGLKVIGQAMNTFIVAETRHGIVVVDQHVAHERVLYEYLCGQKGSNLLERQPLLVPETLNLDRRTAVLLREKLDELERIGFHLEPFGADSYLVRAVPAALRGKSPLKMLRDLAEELAEQSVARRLVPTREQLWITASCKMAVKAGDPLSHAEMDKLIQDLAETENPYLCPHGRPITLTLSLDDLLRKFKRA